jgi:small subunit ribosomal protein S2
VDSNVSRSLFSSGFLKKELLLAVAVLTRKKGTVLAMSVYNFTLKQLLESGIHFGHTTRRWNPKMKPFIHSQRGGIHIIDLKQTYNLLGRALHAIQEVVSKGGRVLFVGTKRQASDKIKEMAQKCGQYYINHRWLGGTLTNWKTVLNSIKRLKELQEKINKGEVKAYTKKEQLAFMRVYQKLDLSLGGIKDMGGTPDLLFVIDTNKEAIAIQEARKLNIPVIAIVDTNSNPDGIDFPIPGNDDALRAIDLYCTLVCNAVLEGIQKEMHTAGIDVSTSAEASMHADVVIAALAQDEGLAKELIGEEAAAAPAPAPAAPESV